jgi:hypothetical protein
MKLPKNPFRQAMRLHIDETLHAGFYSTGWPNRPAFGPATTYWPAPLRCGGELFTRRGYRLNSSING